MKDTIETLNTTVPATDYSLTYTVGTTTPLTVPSTTESTTETTTETTTEPTIKTIYVKDETTVAPAKKKRTPKQDQLFKEEESTVNTSEFLSVSKHGPVEFLMDKKTFDLMYNINGATGPVSKPDIEKIKQQMKKANKLYVDVKSLQVAQTDYTLWDRVLFYGPTWSGKTHDSIVWARSNPEIAFHSINVTDWFEDIDFLTYIIPTANWIMHKEKDVVTFLRACAEGKIKWCLLIDEINRGSKSFMNLVLKLIDPVSGNYELDNFVQNEKIIIPRDNIIFFCTANFWTSYTGTEQMDEALFDRFTQVIYKEYDQDLEDKIMDNFWEYKADVKKVIAGLREMTQDNTIKRPVSTRTIKTWAENYMNSSQSKIDVLKTFESSVLYRLVSPDAYGMVDKDQTLPVISLLVKLWYTESK